MRWLLWTCCLFISIGCTSVHKKDLLNHSPGAIATEEVLILDNAEKHASRLSEFIEKYPQPTEFDKINYLLASVRNSDCRFFRNYEEYSPSIASRWLRWKMHHRQYKDDPIVTVQRFIDVVSHGSRRTGIPYEIVMENGVRRNASDVFHYEIMLVDNALREKALLDAVNGVPGDEESAVSTMTQERLQAAIMMSATTP